MSYTKRQLIVSALEEIGIASYDFDIQPEQFQFALSKLDAMIANWETNGIRLGYNLASNPMDSELSSDSGLPDYAFEAVITNLAIRLSPSYGKRPTIETKTSAANGYTNLLSKNATPIKLCMPAGMPIGAGNKGYGFNRRFFPQPDEQITIDTDGYLED